MARSTSMARRISGELVFSEPGLWPGGVQAPSIQTPSIFRAPWIIQGNGTINVNGTENIGGTCFLRTGTLAGGSASAVNTNTVNLSGTLDYTRQWDDQRQWLGEYRGNLFSPNRDFGRGECKRRQYKHRQSFGHLKLY